MLLNPYVFAAGGGGGPTFADVVLLLNFDGTNGSTVFTDLSTVGHTITNSGSVVVSTTDPKWGTGCGKWPAGGDHQLSTPMGGAGAPLDLGSDDYTIEFWWRPADVSVLDPLYVMGSAGAGKAQRVTYTGSVITVAHFMGGTGFSWSNLSSGAGVITTPDVWYHVAITREADTGRLFVDGVLKDTKTDWSGTPLFDTTFRIANTGSGDGSLNSAFDDFRVTKGFALYTANFTPPAGPFPTS